MDMHDVTPLGNDLGDLPDPAVSATAVVDAQGIVTGWSSGAERLLGYARREAVGEPASRLFGMEAAAGGFTATAHGWSGTALLRHRDGHHLEVRLRTFPSLDEQGSAQRLIVVTPQQQAQPPEDVTAEEAFRQCHVPVALFDERLRILQTSEGMVREVGMTEARMRGRRITDILPAPVSWQVEEGMRRVLETGTPQRRQVHARPPAGGRQRVWSIALSPVQNRAGHVRRVQLTALDTTDQYSARERLALLNDVSTQVGSTLNVIRTAQEMANLSVGRLADFVSVDLLDPLFRGVEPRPGDNAFALRCAGHQSILPGIPEALRKPGEVDYYPESSAPARCLVTGRPSLHRTLDEEALENWAPRNPGRLREVQAFGIHSFMIIPLRARGIPLDVAVLARHRRPEPFDEDDMLLAEEIGARVAVAVDNALRFTREHTTALALQRSLLPGEIPDQAAVQVAHRYLPARSPAGVGGDWFDVISLSGARVALVVGDVVGHGLRASATMGRLRTAVRTLADVDLSPDELLVHLDELVTDLTAKEDTAANPELEIATDLVATCLYMIYDPVSRRCTAASAGHLPPAVVTPDGTAEFLSLSPGPPLGVGKLPFESIEQELSPDSLLALYTDGLIKAPGRTLDKGLALLRQCLEQPTPSLEARCDSLIQSLRPEEPRDDAALLVARTRALDPSQVTTWKLPFDPAAVASARTKTADQVRAWGLGETAFTIELVVSELVTNAIRYGEPPIQLRLIRGTTVICEVSDSSGSTPHMRRARTFDEGGRGLMIVAQLAKGWGTRPHPGGKTLWADVSLPDEH
jgi:PAS domain S-box-containing protein